MFWNVERGGPKVKKLLALLLIAGAVIGVISYMRKGECQQ